MITLLGAVFLASLAGSLHCAGMCGGLVIFYSGTDATHGVTRMVAHGVYNGGRLIGYLLLGVAAGAIGGVINLAGSLAGWQRVATEILIIYLILLLAHRLVRGTRGAGVLRGLAFLLVIAFVGMLFVVKHFQLYAIEWLMVGFLPIFIVPSGG